MPKQEKITFGKLVFRNGTYQFEITEELHQYDPYSSKKNRMEVVSKEVRYETPEQHGLVKEGQIQTIIRKTSNTADVFEVKESFWLCSWIFKIPKYKKFKDFWLCYVPDECQFVMNELSSGIYYVVSFSDVRFVKMSKPTRISKKKAFELIHQKKVFPRVLDKIGDNYRQILYFAKG